MMLSFSVFSVVINVFLKTRYISLRDLLTVNKVESLEFDSIDPSADVRR